MLVLDVLDNGIPAAIIVNEIAVAGRIDDVEPQSDAVFLNDVGDGVDFGGLADGLRGLQPAFGVDEVGGEDGVDERRFAEAGLACEVTCVSECREGCV